MTRYGAENMKCIECGHDLKESRKTYVANLDNCVIIIKNVPAKVCEFCNEIYYTDDIFTKIEDIVEQLQHMVNDVVVIDYSKPAA